MGRHRTFAGRKLNFRGKHMRVLEFAAYSPEEKDEIGRPAIQSRAWVILWMAVANAPAGRSREEAARGNKVYERLKEHSVLGDRKERSLSPKGARMVFETEEYKVLTDSLEKFREHVIIAGADALVYLDDLLANAPSLKPEDVKAKKVRELKLETAEKGS